MTETDNKTESSVPVIMSFDVQSCIKELCESSEKFYDNCFDNMTGAFMDVRGYSTVNQLIQQIRTIKTIMNNIK